MLAIRAYLLVDLQVNAEATPDFSSPGSRDATQRSGADYNFTHVDQVAPQREGMSAFVLQDGMVHHTYSSYARGVEQLMGTFGYLDVAPLGRNEDPQNPGAW
jgi:predicted dithiol-disulfide oxidoreductase (DUF899 family)